jgi:hypothetical protein
VLCPTVACQIVDPSEGYDYVVIATGELDNSLGVNLLGASTLEAHLDDLTARREKALEHFGVTAGRETVANRKHALEPRLRFGARGDQQHAETNCYCDT